MSLEEMILKPRRQTRFSPGRDCEPLSRGTMFRKRYDWLCLCGAFRMAAVYSTFR